MLTKTSDNPSEFVSAYALPQNSLLDKVTGVFTWMPADMNPVRLG